MKRKFIFIFMLGLTVAAGGLLLWMNSKSPQKKNEVQTRESLDRQVLKQKTAEAGEVYGALVRLSKEGKDQDVLAEALKRYRSEDAKVREAAALALGHFSGTEVAAALQELLQDKNSQVRTQAIVALSFRPSPQRAAFLEGILNQPGEVASSDLVSALYARYASSPDAVLLEKTKTQLLAIGADAKTPQEVRLQALQRLAALSPRDAKLVNQLLGYVSVKTHEPTLSESAMKHLAYIKNEIFYSRAAGLFVAGSPSTRMTLLQILPQICHSARWQIVENAAAHFRDRPLEWRTTLNQLGLISYEEASPYLERLKRHKNFTLVEVQEVDRLMALQKTRMNRNPCQQ